MRRLWWYGVKLFISLALLWGMLRWVDFRTLGGVVRQAQWPWLAVAYSLTVVTIVLRAYKWQLLLSVQGLSVPLRTLSAFCLVGLFFSSVLPLGIGGDVARAYDLSQYTRKAHESVSSVVWDRATGMVALLLLAILGWGWVWWVSPMPMSNIFWWLAAPLGLLGGVVWKPEVLYRFKLPRWLIPYVEACEQMASQRDRLWGILGISLAVQVIAALFSYVAAHALGIRVSLLTLCAVIPLVSAITLLPVSVNGLGIREGAHVILLTRFGVSPAQALVLSLVTSAALFLLGAVGGVVYTLRR